MTSLPFSLFLLLRLTQSVGLGAVFWSYVNRTHIPNDGFFSALDSATLATAADAVDAAQVGFFLLMSFFMGETMTTFGGWIRSARQGQEHEGLRAPALLGQDGQLYFEYQWIILKLRLYDGAAVAAFVYAVSLFGLIGTRTFQDLAWLALEALMLAAICYQVAKKLNSKWNDSIQADQAP